jgi:hypothetical protein
MRALFILLRRAITRVEIRIPWRERTPDSSDGALRARWVMLGVEK